MPSLQTILRLFASLLLAMVTTSTVIAAGAITTVVTQANVQQTICVKGYTGTVRPPFAYTNNHKKNLLRRAGKPLSAIHDYELDHIIPLALGGHPTDEANLMLQPWEGDNGAHRKDRIEVKLQCLVCTGQVPLAQAQAEIGTDWQAAYHRYAGVKCHRPAGRAPSSRLTR